MTSTILQHCCSFFSVACRPTRSLPTVARGVRFLGALALCSLAFSPVALAQVLPPGDASVCSAILPPPSDPEQVRYIPGRWWNPKREGTAWDVVATPSSMIMYWYTFASDGKPVWLLAHMGNYGPDAQTWQSNLYQVQRPPSTGIPNSGEPVGSVAVRFVPNDPTRMAISWNWNGRGATECIRDFSRTTPFSPESTSNVNVAFSGPYWEPAVDGAGSVLSIMQQYRGSVLKLIEVHALLIFDTAGQPTWLQGVGAEVDTLPLGVNRTLDVKYHRALYDPSIQTCTFTGPINNCVREFQAGTLIRTYADNVRHTARVQLYVPSTEVPGGGPEIRWNRPTQTTTPANPALPHDPSAAPVTFNKISAVQGVFVDRVNCTPVNGLSTCDVSVSWTATDPGARLFRWSLNAPVSTSMLPNNAGGYVSSGERLDSLFQGQRYQYKLHQNGSSSSPVIAVSPIVRALTIEESSVPNAPIASLLAELPAHDPTIGAIDAEAGVSGGAATYTVPIKVPPGRRGMQPNLALSYSSRSGNGIAGVGWSLSGLSSIHRCPRTVAQDGYPRAVDFSAQDALCLDGQRLIAKTGSYGQAGATYATEIDSFARITQLGGDLLSTSTYFKVEHKSGEIQYLGATPDVPFAQARSIPQGAPVPLSWLLVRRQDRSGNHATFNYLDYGFGELLLSRVDYTGYGSDVGNRSVNLEYEDRAGGASGFDVSSSFLAGTESRQTKRLKSIITRAPGLNGLEDVRRYRLGYLPGANSGRSLLFSLVECAVEGTSESCLAPTTFDTANVATNTRLDKLQISSDPNVFPVTGLPTDFTPGAGQDSSWAPFISSSSATADFNGDGTRELLVETKRKTSEQGAQETKHFLISVSADRAVSGVHSLPLEDAQALIKFPHAQADFDGDGRTDIVTSSTHPSGQQRVAFKFWRASQAGTFAGGSFTASVPSNIELPPNQGDGTISYLGHAGDLDGNGRPDLVLVRALPNPTPSCKQEVQLWVNQTDSSVAPVVPSFARRAAPVGLTMLCLGQGYDQTRDVPYVEELGRVADIDGNGLLDLQITRKSTPSGALSWIHEVVFLHRELQPIAGCTSIGANQDLGFCRRRFSDLLTSPAEATLRELQATNLTHFWADFNGDGLDDWLYADTSGCGSGGRNDPIGLCWSIRFGTGRGLSGFAFSRRYTTGVRRGLEQTVGGLSGHLRAKYERLLRIGDTNSDGRAEILIPDWARPFASVVCSAYKHQPGTCPIAPAAPAAPGAVLTHPLPCEDYYVCPTSPSHTDGQPRTNAGPFASRDVAFLTDSDRDGVPDVGSATGTVYVLTPEQAPDSGGDPSTYRLRPWSVSAGIGSTGVVGMVEDTQRVVLSSGHSEDVFGDGLTDALSQLPHPRDAAGSIPRLAIPYRYANNDPVQDVPFTLNDEGTVPVFWRALVIERNLGAGQREGTLPPLLPEMLQRATDGFGNIARWEHFPLASSAGRQPESTPLYSVAARTLENPGYVDAQHLYFTSSMPVVATFQRSNGLGTLNAVNYGYSEAMYNVAGLGFQGFRAIVEEDLVQSRRTRTTFHQKVPLTGLVESSVQSVLRNASGVTDRDETWLIGREVNDWRCQRPNRGYCVYLSGQSSSPFVDSQITTKYDVNSPGLLLATTTTNNYVGSSSGWDAYGNLLNQVQILTESGADASIATHITTTATAFSTEPVYLNEWWTDRKTRHAVSSQITYAAGHALPAGAQSPERQTLQEFAWNGDRTLLWERLQNGIAAQQKITTFGYPTGASSPCAPSVQTNFGMPSSVRVEAWGDTNLSRQTFTSYTADGYFPCLITNAVDQQSSVTTRARDGLPSQTIDIKGLATDFTYDAFGRPRTMSFPGPIAGTQRAPTKHVAMTACSGAACVDDYLGRAKFKTVEVQDGSPSITTTFDSLGRAIRTKRKTFNGSESVSETGYTVRGFVQHVTEPHAPGAASTYKTINRFWDALGRVTARTIIKRVNGLTTQLGISYGYFDHRTAIWECDGQCRPPMYRYADAMGRHFKTLDQQGGETRFWYDAVGNAVAIKDAAGSVTRASYNSVGHRLSMSDPNKGTWNFGYNALGELLSQTDARGVTTSYSYDKLGRMTARNASVQVDGIGGPEFVSDTWEFDPVNGAGELWRSTRFLGTDLERRSAYTYDVFGRPALMFVNQAMPGATGEYNHGLTYQYDAYYGRIKEMAHSAHERVWYKYDAYGYPLSESDAMRGTVYRQTGSVDGRGLVNAESFGGLINGSYVFDPASGQVEGMAYAVGSQVRRNLGYAYDAFGNLGSQTMGATTETYSYDELHRLTRAVRTGGNAAIDYSFDAVGNPTRKSDFSSNFVGAYAYTGGTGGGGPNAVKSVQLAGGGSRTYSYDANGNQVSDSNAMSARFDHQDLPVAINRLGATSELRYTADGERSRQWGSEGRRVYIGKSFEHDLDRNEEKYYIGDYAVATVDRIANTRRVEYLIKDRLGSVDAVLNSAGGIVETRGYDAYGKPRMGNWADAPLPRLRSVTTPNEPATLRGFTQHEHLDRLELIHMNGRVYDYNLGRFLSVDPIIQFPDNSQSLNPYSYILNNPLSGTDPTGYAVACPKGKKGDCKMTGDDLERITRRRDGRVIAETKDGNTYEVKSISVSNGERSRTFSFSNGRATEHQTSDLMSMRSELGSASTNYVGRDAVESAVDRKVAGDLGGMARVYVATAFCVALPEACMGYGLGTGFEQMYDGNYEGARNTFALTALGGMGARGGFVGSSAEAARSPLRAVGDGPVIFNVPKNASAAQVAQMRQYCGGCNAALRENALSTTGRVSTKGALHTQAGVAAARERARAAAAGQPYSGHVGHVPDTTWMGTPQPHSWMDISPSINASLGSQAARYPVGYRPTEFLVR